MSPRGFEADLPELESLRNADPATTLAPIRKFLTNRNNFLVAKAAKLAADHNHRALIPDLVAAYPRFELDPNKSDPQCWAKEAIAKALAAFDYQEPDLFLAGIRTFQPGFTDDAATALRGTCALALVACRGLSSTQVLRHLLPLFADQQLPVRVNAARAVTQLGNDSCALILRLRAELGSDKPELLGACYSGVLALEGPSAIPWAAKFLQHHSPDEASDEAAFAIAETRTEPAVALLRKTYTQTRDKSFRETLLTALALTRHEAAYEFLFTLVAEGHRPAREALENSAPPQTILDRLDSIDP
jgi:HEAT repeat protein